MRPGGAGCAATSASRRIPPGACEQHPPEEPKVSSSIRFESPRDILKRHGLSPKHSWGQNFLGDPDALAQITDALLLRKDEPVVELGPGLGHLTRFLAATGARVTAVERDRDMVAVLEKEAIPGVRVVAGNAATVDFAEVAGVPEVKVAGNLPYHLTSPILFRVLEQRASVMRAVFTLQKEVV